MATITSTHEPRSTDKYGQWLLPRHTSMTAARGEVMHRLRSGQSWAWAGLMADGNHLRRVVVQSKGGAPIEAELDMQDEAASLERLRQQSAAGAGAGPTTQPAEAKQRQAGNEPPDAEAIYAKRRERIGKK